MYVQVTRTRYGIWLQCLLARLLRATFPQSPQLATPKCIAVFNEIPYGMGLVLGEETSNTHRYLREYTGLDIDMTAEEQYREALEIIHWVLEAYVRGHL